MTIDDCIIAAVNEATRKVKTTTDLGAKYNSLLNSANRLQKQWANSSGVDWFSLYNGSVSCGDITATDTFALDSTIRKISPQEGDYIAISKAGQFWYYNEVPANRFRSFVPGGADPWTWGTQNTVARVGGNLTFAIPFISTSPQLGGTLEVPAFLFVTDIVSGTDVVQVDDPNWLIDMLAAEWARNDKTRQYMEPNFVADANEKMAKMVSNNGSQLEELINLTNLSAAGETW